MSTHNYQKLDVWQRAINLVVMVYELCKQLPQEERYALADQMRRAAVSIPSNIAEGQQRFSYKDTVRFNDIALGSLAELETQLILAEKVYNITVKEILEECAIITHMLHALNKSLRATVSV